MKKTVSTLLRNRWFFFIVASFLAVTVSLMSARGQSGITYVYDELGRLIAVIDPSGDTARYNYDAVGNILSITRQSSSTLSFISFTPASGPIGSNVSIYGTAFSTTPSQNTVTFNGVTATVVSSTATKIVATVPTGATTGLISVTTSAGTVSSATSFAVVAGSGQPTIASFSPAIGIPGTAVTITGTNFQSPAVRNKTKFNITNALVSSATATSISTNVPILSGSGKISVSTPYGTATSTDDFYVPPSPNTAADVAVTGRMSSGNSQTVNITTAGKIGMFLFEATAGQHAAVKVTSSSITSTYVAILNPNGSIAAWTYVGSTGYIDTPLLTTTGTHAIVVDPNSTYTGSITFTLYVTNDVTGSITPGGSAVTVTTTTPGQNGRYLFTGTANQRISLKVSSVSLSGGGNLCNVTITKPNGLPLVSQNFNATTFIDTKVLPANGTYLILVDPADSTLASVTLNLYDVPDDYYGGIFASSQPVSGRSLIMGTPGQNSFVELQLTVGQRLSVNLTGAIFGPGGDDYYTFQIIKPDGSTLISHFLFGSNYVDVFTVTVEGTYLLVIDPAGFTTGNLYVTVNDVPADNTGTITPGGSSQTVTNTVPGQNGVRTFSGTANQRVSLNVSSISLTGGTYNYVTVALKKPDGSNLTSQVFQTGVNGFIDTQTLPTTGTYSIVVDPFDTSVGSVTLTLNDVPADATGSITVGGSATTLTTTVAGQNAKGTFDGTTDQQMSVAITNNTMGNVTVSLLRPDGSLLTSTTSSSSSFTLSTQSLTSTGTHTVKIDPPGTNTGSISVAVTDLSGSSATLAADYQFQNSRSSSVGSPPALTDIGGTNSFSSATVDSTSTTVLTFSQNNGLSLSSTSGVTSSSTYSIVMLFSFQSTSGFRRVADFKNGSSDYGVYVNDGKLRFYPAANASSASISANTYVQVVLTRDSSGTVTGYVDGVQQFQFSDSSSYGVIDSNNTLRFFKDDGSSEASAGSVARIRIYNGALTATQVAALSRLP
jgi:YD repeat-containing protein